MCKTFIMRCICGHEFDRKVMKCAEAIRSQLDLAEIDIVEDSGAARTGCVCEIDLPEEYLKPDICEQCKNKGLVCDYLDNDPSVKFDIVKEWLAQKRAHKTRLAEVDLDEDAHMMEEPVADSSTFSTTSSDPNTPTSKTRSSDICILELDQDSHEAELMTPLLLSDCIVTRVNLTRTDLDQSKPEVTENEPNLVSKQVRGLDEVHDLKHRAAALEKKLHLLIAENKQRRALEAKD